MSNNLPWTALSPNMDNPEDPINIGFGIFDAVNTTAFVANVSAGNVVVTPAQSGAAIIRVTNATTSGRIVTLPDQVRVFYVHSVAANTQTVTVKRGTTEITLPPDSAYLIRTDGTANGMEAIPVSSSSAIVDVPSADNVWYARRNRAWVAQPFEIGLFAAGKPDDNETLFRYVVTGAMTILNTSPSRGVAGNAATASTVLSIRKNNVEFATLTFAASSATAVYAQTSSTTFVAGDIISVHCPVTADVSLADISITLSGARR